MKTTFSPSDLASDMSAAGTVREPMKRSIWVALAIAVLVVAAPTPSDAQPPATCKAMCQRLTDCKMASYTKMCLDTCKQYGYEASEEGRAQLLTLTRYSCQQIQSTLAGTGGHQPQRSSPRPGSGRNPARTDSNDDEMDQLDNELDDAEMQRGGAGAPARGAEGSTPIRGNSRRPAVGSSSHSGDNCAPVCDRFEQCRLWKRDSCMGYCSSNTVDPAKNLLASQWSCPKLGAWMQSLGVSGSSSGGDSGNSGGWTCTAEASVGTANGNMPMIYSTKSAYGNGPNRGAASVKALKDCGALVGAALNLAWLSGEQTEGGNCVISRCMQSQ